VNAVASLYARASADDVGNQETLVVLFKLRLLLFGCCSLFFYDELFFLSGGFFCLF
jgi:hypothetical protein